jgi:hypothetical protein
MQVSMAQNASDDATSALGIARCLDKCELHWGL